MLSSLLMSLYRRLGVRSLRTKILLLSVALVLLCVIGGTIVFAAGSRLMHRSLLEQQLSAEADGVMETMHRRAEAISGAGQILAGDPDVAHALGDRTDAAELVLHDRARVVQDRFDIALVQVYDQRGLLRAEITRSSIRLDGMAISSLLDLAEPGKLVARAVENQVLMLYRAPLPEGAGTVVLSLDLEHELRQIRTGNRLSADLGVALRGTQVSTVAGLPFDAQGGWEADQHSLRRPILLGTTPAELLLVRSRSEDEKRGRAALLLVVGSTLLVALLLSSLNVGMIRSLGRRLDTLSAAAQAVGEGDLQQEIRLAPNALTVGASDELGLLADSLNEMISNLRNLLSGLEAEVEAHTAALAITAGVSQAASSSLELEAILSRSAHLILEHLGRVCPEVYHVGLFLAEQGSDTVVLREVANEAREDLGRKSVRILVGSQSPVGLAVATKHVEVVQDVRLLPVFLKPPLLMDTYSAAAVPLLVGDTLIGALDVQSKQPGAFSPDALQLLNTLANQIATAVYNARRYQRQCQTAEHLTEVDQLKTQFLAMMSHKFRAPLNTITGLSRGLIDDEVNPLSRQQERDASLICSLGQHLLELTDDFLDISKLRAGKITLHLEDVDLRLLIESSLDAVAPLVEDRPITLHADIASNLPVVRADKRRIRQVMLNLLSNAVAFTEAGRISVHARGTEALNADTGRMEPFVEVSISDTGLVISKDRLIEGFRAFDRPDFEGSTTPFPECVVAGFALPITEALIDLHGGRIWVDGELAKRTGTAFTFVLPV